MDSEAQLLAGLRKIRGDTGTKVQLYNLIEPCEFDFTVADDIQLAKDGLRNFKIKREGQNDTVEVPEDFR